MRGSAKPTESQAWSAELPAMQERKLLKLTTVLTDTTQLGNTASAKTSAIGKSRVNEFNALSLHSVHITGRVQILKSQEEVTMPH